MRHLTFDQLRRLLQTANLKSLAEAIGVSADVLYQFRRGRTKTLKADAYLKLCQHFGGDQ